MMYLFKTYGPSVSQEFKSSLFYLVCKRLILYIYFYNLHSITTHPPQLKNIPNIYKLTNNFTWSLYDLTSFFFRMINRMDYVFRLFDYVCISFFFLLFFSFLHFKKHKESSLYCFSFVFLISCFNCIQTRDCIKKKYMLSLVRHDIRFFLSQK